jgi:hypothetical protein
MSLSRARAELAEFILFVLEPDPKDPHDSIAREIVVAEAHPQGVAVTLEDGKRFLVSVSALPQRSDYPSNK